jgi:hypothetical protein
MIHRSRRRELRLEPSWSPRCLLANLLRSDGTDASCRSMEFWPHQGAPPRRRSLRRDRRMTRPAGPADRPGLRRRPRPCTHGTWSSPGSGDTRVPAVLHPPRYDHDQAGGGPCPPRSASSTGRALFSSLLAVWPAWRAEELGAGGRRGSYPLRARAFFVPGLAQWRESRIPHLSIWMRSSTTHYLRAAPGRRPAWGIGPLDEEAVAFKDQLMMRAHRGRGRATDDLIT